MLPSEKMCRSLHYYGFEVLDVWEVVERVAMNTRNRVASPTNA